MIINGIFWKIKFIPNTDTRLKRSDGTLTFGVTILDTHTVYISDKINGALLKKVLTHEICHAYIFSYGIYMPISEEERLCDFVATYGEEVVSVANSFIEFEFQKLSKDF